MPPLRILPHTTTSSTKGKPPLELGVAPKTEVNWKLQTTNKGKNNNQSTIMRSYLWTNCFESGKLSPAGWLSKGFH
jgi:hypothetical protein